MSDLLEQHRRMVAQGMKNLGIVTPDEAAQKHETARKLGVPVQAVYDAPKESLIAVTVRNMWDGTRDAPGLREALGAEDFYRVANDDVQALSAVEVAARNASLMGVAGRAVPDPLGEMRAAPDAPWYRDVYDSFARGWHNARAAEGLQGNFITDSIGDARRRAAESAGVSYDADIDKAVYYLDQKRRAGRYAPDASLYAQQAGYAGLNAREASFGELFGYLRENPGFVFNTVSESMGANMPGLARTAAAGFVNPLAAAAMAGSSSFDVEYNATVAEGMEAEAGKYGGGIKGVVNALGNRDAMAAAEGKAVRRGSAVGLFDGLTAGFGGQIIKGARSLWGAVPRVVGEGAVQAGGGAAGEAAAQALTGEYKPGDILMEAVAEIPTGAFEAHGNYREEVRNIQAERARRNREHLDIQTANTQASKLTARAPDMQAEFVNKGYGDAARIYVDADALMQSGRAAEVAEKIPGAAEKIAEAVQSGGAVELTRGEYHAFLSAEAQQDLNAHIRATPEAMSAEEARQWAESGEQEAMRSEVEAEAANLAAAESASSERKAAFARELSGTGLVNRKQAQAYAAYYVGSVENLAQRLEMSPEAFEERYGRLSVSSESLIEDGVLNQTLASAPPKGWVHSTNPQDVIGLWDDTTSARTIFWTGIDNQVAVEAAEASDYSHSISADVVRHIKNRHGNDADGQLPVTAEDLVKIPEIIANYDEVRTNLQNPKTGGQRVAYVKRSEDSLLIYLEEYVRSRNNLKGVSMWKYPPTADVGNVLAHITRPSLYVRNGVAAYNDTTADTGSNQDVLFQSATNDSILFQSSAVNELPDGVRGFYDRAGRTVTLLKNADASTFIHESGHYYLDLLGRIYQDLAGRDVLTDAEAQVVSDFETLLAWSGVKDAQAWFGMEAEAQRVHHEKIARAFEAYVFEGKAPDSRLREVFARMARWMRQVYRSLAGLDVELSDEVRGVFDRLLASDDAIAEAEYVNHMRPLLKEGDFADEGAWQAYLAANEAAHTAAADELGAKAVRDMRFARNLRSDVLRKLRRRHKADFERAEMAARGSIMKQPVYRAWQFLTAEMTDENRIDGNSKEEREFRRKAKVLQGKPVYTIDMRTAPQGFKALREWAQDIFDKAGNQAANPEIGTVLLNERSVRDSIAHGMNPFKAEAFQAVPDVIEKGAVVHRGENPENGVRYAYISAPVVIEGKEDIVTVLVRDSGDSGRMYLHSVATKESILNASDTETTEISRETGKVNSGYIANILRSYLKYKPKTDRTALDPSSDSLMTAIAKLGGLNKDELVREWGIDPKDKIAEPVFGMPVLRRSKGRSIDEMAELLAEEGYLPTDNGKADVRDLEERFSDGLKGRDYFSIHYVPREEVKPGAELANPYALTAARLDAASLDGIPQGWSEVLSARGMVAKRGGLHPDIAAELVLDEDGRQVFPTGEDLLRALVEAEPPQEAIENTAYLNLLAQFGEVPTAADFEAAADAAAHNGLRLRILAAEFAALKKETGSVSYLKRAAGLIAREKLETVKVADVRPHVFASAESRAGRQAEKAFSKGDTARAAEFKRRQLVQSAMAREAYRVREEMEKTHRYLSGFRRVKTGIDLEYRQQIDALLSAVGLKKAAASEEVPSLHALLAQMEEDGRPHNLDAEMFNALSRKDYRDMTVGEVRDLADQVRQLEFLGRNKNKMLASKAKLDYEAVRDEITASVRANSNGRTARTRTAATKLERSADRVRGFFWGHLKLSAIARILDGGKDAGPVWQYLVRPINEAGDAEAARMAEMTAKLAAVMKPLEQALKKQRGKKQYAGIGGLTRQQLFAMALNTGNEGNLQRLLSGGYEGRRNLDIRDVRAALSDLTADEWRAVQAVWDLFESMRPEVAELERRTTGTEPKWVEAAPMTVRTSDGQEVELRGGYYPIGYDPKGSMAAERQAAASEAKADWSAAKMAASTRGGYVKDRAAKVENRPVLLNLSVVYNGLNDIIHDLTHRAAVTDANRLLRSYSIDAAVRETLGAEALRQMRAAVQDVARGHGDVQAMDGMAGMMRHGVGMAGLGFNLVSAAVQITGFVPAIARIGGKYTAVGLSAWLSNPWAAARSAGEQSDFMANRSRTRFRELNEVANTLNGNKVRLFLNRYAYWLMMKVQQVVDTVVWHGALAKALSEGHGQELAARLADQAVLDTQGGGQVKDQSALERGGSLSKLFTVFYSYMNAALNQGVVQMYTQQNRMRLAAELLLIWVVPNVLTVLMKEALVPGDDGEDLAKKLAKEQISFMLGLFVGARELSSLGAIVTGSKDAGYSGVGGTRVISDALRFAKQARQGEADEAFVRASINFSGSLFGLPAAQANRSLKGYRALKEGKTDNPAALLFGYEGK